MIPKMEVLYRIVPYETILCADIPWNLAWILIHVKSQYKWNRHIHPSIHPSIHHYLSHLYYL